MLAVALAAVLGLGCAQAAPRFAPDVQTSLAQEDMRRIETDHIRLYHPARDRETAMRMLSRFEGCVAELRKLAKVDSRASREKLVIVVPRVPLNNAFVRPATMGQEHVSVTPTFNTSDVFTVFGLPPDPSTIGCHEMVHYVHSRQLSGIPNVLETIFGYGISPELGLEPWFWEGLAVYYETKLQRGTGRLASLLWNGTFAAGVAEEGLREADLNEATRGIPFGGSYLVGSHFIDWLAGTFGEDRLWNVIERQSDEVVFPVGVSGRFTNAFGRPLARLYSDFVAHAKKRYPKRPRPTGEREIRRLGQDARYAVAPDGTEAIFDQSVDTPARLRVFSPAGELLVERNLTDLVPGRDLVGPSALASSGISFTADSRHLYWTALDVGYTFPVSRLVHLDLETQALSIVAQDLGGAGGSIAPDGSGYFFSRAKGDRWELARYDIASGVAHGIADYGPRTYVVGPRVSPDGRKLAFTVGRSDGVDVLVADAVTGTIVTRPSGPLGDERSRTEPSWWSDDELLYVGEADGRAQVFRARLSTSTFERLSDAPYVASHPQRKGERVRFLSRAGWVWSVDEIDGALLGPVPPSPALASHAQAVATAPPDPRVDVDAEGPYRQTDGLFVPTLRGPSAVAVSNLSTSVGMGFSGGDRLGFHRWALEGSWDFAANEPSATVRYINGQLAPVIVGLAGQRLATRENVLFETPAGEVERRFVRRETAAALAVARQFWTTTVTTGLRYDEIESARGVVDPTVLTPQLLATHSRFAGPHLGVSYAAIESTAASGARRALTVDATSGFFPAFSAPATGDLRLALGVVLPLPISRRHTLALQARGRALPSTRTDVPSLQVGGNVASTTLASDVSGSGTVNDLPLALRFQEPLRGFEDLGLLGSRALLGDVTYRLPIVLDVGSISTISILPSLLLRQIDLEAFGSGATLLDGRLAAAAGGAAIARFKLWIVPFGLGLQVSRRLTQDEGFNVIFAGGG